MRVGVYDMVLDNLDGYVDLTSLQVVCWDCLMRTLQPEGLLGQTWNASAPLRHSDADVEQYREQQDDLLGCDTPSDKLCKALHADADAVLSAAAV